MNKYIIILLLIADIAIGKNNVGSNLKVCEHNLNSCKQTIEDYKAKCDSDSEQLKQQSIIYKKQRDELYNALNNEINNEPLLPGWAYFTIGTVFTVILIKINK